VAETFPPASVGSTVDTYLILYGQCGCPESAGNAVAWTDPKSSRMSAYVCATAERSPDCALQPKGCLRYLRDELRLAARHCYPSRWAPGIINFVLHSLLGGRTQNRLM